MKRDRIKTFTFWRRRALICALLALPCGFFEATPFCRRIPGAVGQGLSALAAPSFGFALAFTLYAAVILLPLLARRCNTAARGGS